MTSTIVDRNGGTTSASPVADLNTGLSSSAATKAPCRAAATTNITLSGTQTVDGVALVAADRCLVTGQTDQTQNGIYLVASGSWTRSPDFNRTDDVRKGSQVRVTDGTSNSGLWIVTASDPIGIGSSNLTFSRDTNLTNGAVLKANNLSDLSNVLTAHDNIRFGGATVAASAWTLNLDTATSVLTDQNAGDVTAVTLGANKERITRLAADVLFTPGSTLHVNGSSTLTYQAGAGDLVFFRGYGAGLVRLWVLPKTAGGIKAANVASATAVTLTPGALHHITGTTTISSILFSPARDGAQATAVFDGALTLTYNATSLILPGAASIVTVAGDRAIFVQDGSGNARCIDYTRVDGTPVSLAFTRLLDLSGAAAGQIKFPATQNSSSNANTNDDYEEGTYTPGQTFGGGNTGLTTSVVAGNYTKIGRNVSTIGIVILSAKGSSTGTASQSGLPFGVQGGIPIPFLPVMATMTSLTGAVKGSASSAGGTSIDLKQSGSAGDSNITDTSFTTTSSIEIAGNYLTST